LPELFKHVDVEQYCIEKIAIWIVSSSNTIVQELNCGPFNSTPVF